MGEINKKTIYLACRAKADELLNSYFGDFHKEAALERPENIKEKYDEGLPARIEAEFSAWLAELWAKTSSDPTKSFTEVMNLHKSLEMTDQSYLGALDNARQDAEKVTLIERITKSKHKDVTYYVGLLKQYSEERLDVMIKDFVGDYAD